MKKTIALLLAICTVLTLFAACGSEEKPVTTQSPQASTQEVTSNATTEAPETQTPEAKAPEVSIPETVIYDADGIKITATGMENDGDWGKGIKFLVENSTDKNIAFSGDNFVINGITVYGYLYIEVAAGKKANGTLEIDYATLDNAQISEIATIVSYDAYIVDTDSYDTLCTVPFSIESSVSGSYTQAIDETGEVLFDQDGIVVIAQYISDAYYGNMVRMLVKNNTGKDIICEAENVSVNGFTISAWMYNTIYTASVSYCELEIFSDSLEENGIEEVEEITFTLNFIDNSSYSTITTSDELQLFVVK